MKNLKFLIALLLIASCGGGGGGGGGGVPFALTLASNVFSLNEDTTYTGSLSASANEAVTLTYSVTTQTTNGSITLSQNGGSVSYTPNANFNGTDSFTYSVTAVEKSIVRDSTVTILSLIHI